MWGISFTPSGLLQSYQHAARGGNTIRGSLPRMAAIYELVMVAGKESRVRPREA